LFGFYSTSPSAARVSLVQHVEHRDRWFTVASIPFDQYKIDLVGEPSARKVTEQCRPLLMMNAGMFHANHEPVGLQIIDGTVLNPINKERGKGNFFMKPNGVFAMGTEGVVVVATDAFDVSKLWRIATQSGPLLLLNGEYHPKIKLDSPNLHIRNGVCV
jgi:uncharacterized protein YigE (DUF2233 family)